MDLKKCYFETAHCEFNRVSVEKNNKPNKYTKNVKSIKKNIRYEN